MAVFNREDGQLALGTKTPVSILQEMLHKKGLTPQYELIYNGVGTPNPRFKFRVSAEGITAIGDGKTKKEAKHDAAATLLKRLLTSKVETENMEWKEEVDIASPYTGALKTNYVGMLDEICFYNKIPTAIYVLVLEEGPPHARVFTMRCELSSISETAVARTKKQAKHLVAQRMIERVKGILKDRFVQTLEVDEAADEIVSDQEKIRNGSFHHDLSFRVKDLHNVFQLRNDEQPVPSIFQQLPEKPEEYYESTEKPLEFLEEIVEALEGVVKTKYMSREEFERGLQEVAEAFEDCCESDGEDAVTEDEPVVEGDICVKEDEPSEANRVVANVLPDYPLSDDEDDQITRKIENIVLDVEDVKDTSAVEDVNDTSAVEDVKDTSAVEDVKDTSAVEDVKDTSAVEDVKDTSAVEDVKDTSAVEDVNDTSAVEDVKDTSAVEDFAVVYCFVKVEVRRGFWEFIGRGSNDQDALEKAARCALKFLRTMAVQSADIH